MSALFFFPVPIVKLAFSSQAKKLKAEKYRGEIMRAFEAVIYSAIILEICCELKNIDRDIQGPSTLSFSGYGSARIKLKQKTATNQRSLYAFIPPENCTW